MSDEPEAAEAIRIADKHLAGYPPRRRLALALDIQEAIVRHAGVVARDAIREAHTNARLRPPSISTGELGALRQAIIDNTKGDLFWIGEILLSELQKETGFDGGAKSASH